MQDPNDNLWYRLTQLQPATWRGIVMAVFALLAVCGIKFAPAVPDAAFLVIIAALPIIQGLWTKKAVTPNAKVAIRVPDPIDAPNIIEAGPAAVNAPEEIIISAAQMEGPK